MGSYKVYKYTFPNGMIYVGCTRLPLHNRWNCGYHHNNKMIHAKEVYKWEDIEKEIIGDGLTKEQAYELEINTIESLHATDEDIGYNISYGGGSTFAGLKHTDEHRKYMSELYKGKVFSEKTLQRMRDSHAKERHRVVGINKDGTVVEFDSMTDAGKKLGCCTTTISRVCKRRGTYKGIHFIPIE